MDTEASAGLGRWCNSSVCHLRHAVLRHLRMRVLPCARHSGVHSCVLQGVFGAADTPMSSNSLNAILDELGK